MANITKSLIANLYNPHEQSQEELIERFVVRQHIFGDLSQAMKRSEMTVPVQHYLIEGQRGMGKTTLLLRLSYAIEHDADLQSWLIPIVFKEEAYYGIRRLFNLWETLASELAGKDRTFSGVFDDMSAAYREETEYEQICFKVLSRALEAHSKKLILFIDNFGELLRNFREWEQHRFYEVLHTSPLLRIVGASAVALQAFADIQDDFADLFHTERLEGLNREETHALLLEMAKSYGQEESIHRIITEQPGRIESLRILTGGVIRTIVLLFEVFTDQEDSSTLMDLDIVLDRVTPLYKGRMDDLSPLQREVVNTIALQWDAVSLEEIARKARLQPDDIEAVLQELEHLFIIERDISDSSPPLYRLKERFFNIWYLMRLTSGSSQARVIWLVHFLEGWYNKSELVQHAQKHIRTLSRGQYQSKAAYYLTEALAQSGHLDQETEHRMIQNTRKLLERTDLHLAAELSLSEKEIFTEGEQYYQQEQYEHAITSFLKLKQKNEHIYFRLGYAFNQLEYYQEATTYLVQAAEQGHVDAMLQLGLIYHRHLYDPQASVQYYDMASQKGRTDAMFYLGNLYYHTLQDYRNAEKYYLMAVKEGQVRSRILTSGSFSLKGLKNYLVTAIKGEVNNPEQYQFQDFPGARDDYLQIIEQTSSEAMFQLGNLYNGPLQDRLQAETFYQFAAKAGHTEAAIALADLYNYTLRDYKKAEKYYLMAADKDDLSAIVDLGLLYHDMLKNNKKSEKYYKIAAERGDLSGMNGLAWLYFEQKREKHAALEYARRVIEEENNIYTAHTVACIYLWNNQVEEALQLAEKFMYAPEAYLNIEHDILFYLMLLLAKEQYQQIASYFESPALDLQQRFAPLLYALLYFLHDPSYRKRPPELVEPVDDIIRRVKQMTKDYA